ncbi:MAG: SIMPL domain-containing protein [Mycobacterium sp.]|uniref:SIMPL domain-containing protein n=1 Tax=Mycobacterium sp. TaxID=1785 RepID=UPI003CC546B9
MPFAGSGTPLRFCAVAGLTLALVSGCDSGGDEVPRQVTVVGSGQVQGAPDTLTADVGIEFTATDVTAATNQSNQRQQAVIDAVDNAGVDRKDISTTGLTVQPQYDGTAGTITGYRAENTIQIKIRKLDSASHVLAVVVSTGGDATRISSVRYSIEDESQLVKDARARAFQDAENRAEQYARLSELQLGQVVSISEAPSTVPPTATQRAPMATDIPLEPGRQTVSFSVTVVWELF